MGQAPPKKELKTIIDENIEKYMKLLRYPRNAEEFNVKKDKKRVLLDDFIWDYIR